MKAQMFMEIILGLSIMVLVFIVTIGTLNYFIIDSPLLFSSEKDDLIESFQLQVNLIEQSSSNVAIKFIFPGRIADDTYNLHILQQNNRSLMVFNFSSGMKQIEIPKITNLTPVNNTGTYQISKIDNQLYIKYQ